MSEELTRFSLDLDFTKMASTLPMEDGADYPEQMRWAYRYKKFRDAPPKYPGLSYPWRWRKPVGETEDWRCSVYYYWWEYMRRSERYRMICRWHADGNAAELKRLTEAEKLIYSDFGDVHATDFHRWWMTHFQLFAREEGLTVTSDTDAPEIASIQMYGRVGQLSVYSLYRQVTADVLGDVATIHYKEVSEAYGTWGRYVLPTLQTRLDVWDAKIANPDANDADIADIAGLKVVHGYDEAEVAHMKREGLPVKDLERAIRRAKQLAVQRHLRIAQQYIDNLMEGWFPMRFKR